MPLKMADPEDKQHIIIIGGGIIGCTTAYYLTRHPQFNPSLHSITLIEANRIASGASGKAGGLLASWAYPKDLAELSFDLHQELADEHNGSEQWGYRRVFCGHLTAVGRRKGASIPPPPKSSSSILLGKWRRGSPRQPSVLPPALDWFTPESARAYEEIAEKDSTAQVNPLQFTTRLAALAEERGAKIVIGPVESINCVDADAAGLADVPVPLASFDGPGQAKVVSVTYKDAVTSDRSTIPATTILLAAGPWTPTLLPGAPISCIRAHSVTFRPKRPLSAYCLFTEITMPDASRDHIPDDKQPPTKTLSPEIYARPNNEVYLCGQGDVDAPLPAATDPVDVSPLSCQEIIEAAVSVSDELRDGQVTGKRACYLPTVDMGGSGGPLIGPTEVEGLVLAAGHSCWGILNAPATGKVVSELILDGEAMSVNIDSLNPLNIL